MWQKEEGGPNFKICVIKDDLKGSCIKKVMQLGESVSQFCHTMYEYLSKAVMYQISPGAYHYQLYFAKNPNLGTNYQLGLS